MDQLPEQLSPAMFTFREKLHQSQEIITDKMVEKRYSPDAFKCIFFQGEYTFKKCTKLMVNDHWKPKLDELLKSIEKIYQDILDIKSIPNKKTKTKKYHQQ